jgi:hypothetical protein
VYEETGTSYVNNKGKTVIKTVKSTRLAEATDARALSSGTPIENIYADYSNRLKGLANQARKTSLTTGGLNYSPTAKQTYGAQVDMLNVKLNTALKNKPLERQAQLLANSMVSAKTQANPGMEAADLKKVKGQALSTARERVGAKKAQITITPDEWEAIQAGAVSTNKLSQILDNADIEQVRALATPRAATVMTTVKVARAKAMLDAGYTQAEIADALGVATSTLNESLSR